MVNYENREDEFIESQEEAYKKTLKRKLSPEYQIYENFIKEIKDLFMKKYQLVVKSIRLELILMNGCYYLLDVEKLVFKQYLTNKDPKMKFEKFISTFKETHTNKNMLFGKETENISEAKSLFDSMLECYNKVLDKNKIHDHLRPPKKDTATDEAFALLREGCPYSFSKLVSDDISTKTFLKYCSNKLVKY